jgi:hypothetical protein
MLPGFLTIGAGDNIPAYTLESLVISAIEASGNRVNR